MRCWRSATPPNVGDPWCSWTRRTRGRPQNWFAQTAVHPGDLCQNAFFARVLPQLIWVQPLSRSLRWMARPGNWGSLSCQVWPSTSMTERGVALKSTGEVPLQRRHFDKDPLQPWRCSARWFWPTSFWLWVGGRCSALDSVSFPTIKATFSSSWTRRRSTCQHRPSLCSSSSGSMLQGFNWHLRTWRVTTTNGPMNLPIQISLAFALTGNYQWARPFPILNFCGLFIWMTRQLPLNLRVTIPNVVRPTTTPPKVHWSQVAAADFLLTVVFSHLNPFLDSPLRELNAPAGWVD